MWTVQQRVAVAASVVFAGVASGQTGFQPASELVAVEPPAAFTPYNAGPVILGLGQRYVIVLPADATHPFDRVATTQDFVQIQELALPPGGLGPLATGASEDGLRAVARVAFPSTDTFRACVWVGDTPTLLNVHNSQIQQPAALSADGGAVVVNTDTGTGERAHLVVNGQSTIIAPPPEEEDPPLRTHGTALSPDGLTATGLYNGANGQPFIWSAATGWSLLLPPFAGQAFPVMISDGGKRLVCRPLITANNSTPTYAGGRWLMIPAFNPKCMSRDGSLVLGGSSQTGRATVWSETIGREDLRDALVARGIDVRGWTLSAVEYISADGRKIVGRGSAPEDGLARWWVATVEPFAAADIGKAGGFGGSDGKLDNNDFIVFINRFFAEDARADVGKAGGVRGADGKFDNNDFCAFIGLFFSREP